MLRRKRQQPQSEFMHYVQLHERAWGGEVYAGRPNLSEILDSPVVVFWQVEGKPSKNIITLYNDIRDLEKFVTRMLLLSSVDIARKRLSKVFVNQKRVHITAVKLIFSVGDEE